MIGYILDSVVIVLLVVTIGYAVRLSAKLNIIKNQKQDFANSIKAFQEASESAIIAVKDLHERGEAICKLLDEKITKAGLVGDEIEFITDRARKQLIGLKAIDSKTVASAIRPALPVAASNSSINSLAEAQLLKALRDREFREALNG